MNKYQELMKKNESIELKDIDVTKTSFLDRYYIYCILSDMALNRKDRNYLIGSTSAVSIMVMLNDMSKNICKKASELIDKKFKDIASITLENYPNMIKSQSFIFRTKMIRINFIVNLIIIIIIGVVFSLLSFKVFDLNSIVHILVNIALIIYSIFILPKINMHFYQKWIASKINKTSGQLDETLANFSKIDFDNFYELNMKYHELIQAKSEDDILKAIKNLPKNIE